MAGPLCFFLCLSVTRESRAVEPAEPSHAAHDAGPAYLRAMQRAAEAYARRDFSTALERLDEAEQIQAGVPDTWSMKGAIYAEQHAYEKAEDAFGKAAQADPGGFWPEYNLAQLLLMQKKFGPAAAGFEKLTGNKQNGELAQFKLVVTDLMAGEPEKAKPTLNAMKFPSDTAAYYFAHAAWEFSHGSQKEGQDFVESGLKVFGMEKCYPYHHMLVEAGWIKKRAEGDAPAAGLGGPMATPGAAGLPAGNL